MKKINFLKMAVFMIALFSLTTQSWAQTTVTLPQACDCPTGGGGGGGLFSCRNSTTLVVDVTNPATGRTWMDRNLGASQAATSSTDAAAYGDLYQWGRCADGHQSRTSLSTTQKATISVPNLGNSWDGLFIPEPTAPWDWLVPQNNNLWQGEDGVNNPCPSGYRLPTDAEWTDERLSWSSNNSAGAFASPLKLPLGGERMDDNQGIVLEGILGAYWSSTAQTGSSQSSFDLNFTSNNAGKNSTRRARAKSVRCIKD